MLMLTKTHTDKMEMVKHLHEMEMTMLERTHSFEKSRYESEISNLHRQHQVETDANKRVLDALNEELKILREKVKPRELEPEASIPLTQNEQEFSHDEINKRVQMWTDTNVNPDDWKDEGVVLWKNPLN